MLRNEWQEQLKDEKMVKHEICQNLHSESTRPSPIQAKSLIVGWFSNSMIVVCCVMSLPYMASTEHMMSAMEPSDHGNQHIFPGHRLLTSI